MSISAPRQDDQEPGLSAANRVVPPPDRESRSVLVVDDNSEILALTSEILKKNGYSVLTARDGLGGVEKFAGSGGPIDLVLLDHNMPRLGGFEAADRIREKDRTVPILILSGDDPSELRERCLTAGVSGYISKPFSLKDFLARIGETLNPAGD